MIAAQTYQARAEDAERLAARSPDGGRQQRAYRELAVHWRTLAEQAARGRLPTAA